MAKAMQAVDYAGLRAEQAQRLEDFKAGRTRTLMGIGISFFTEVVGAGPSKNCDILGIGMFDSCEIRVHPTGSAIARLGTKSQGQGHETTYAQILATEIGIPASAITVEEGDTDTAPYGLGTYGSRSTPVAGAACARVGRKIRHKAQLIASHLLEVHHDDLEWDVDGFQVKGLPERRKSMKELAWAAYNNVPPGMEMGLEAVDYYDPPNFTFPYGAYFCVAEIDVDTGETKIRRFYALDDCGTRINPMIIEGQIHGGLGGQHDRARPWPCRGAGRRGGRCAGLAGAAGGVRAHAARRRFRHRPRRHPRCHAGAGRARPAERARDAAGTVRAVLPAAGGAIAVRQSVRRLLAPRGSSAHGAQQRPQRVLTRPRRGSLGRCRFARAGGPVPPWPRPP
jgi:hypothetical protein